jgi:cell division septum initiation protein DivIVA
MAEPKKTGAAELIEILEQRSLPLGVRGYDRSATDRLLAQLDEGLKVVLQQQTAAQSRLSDLERRIAERQDREEAVTEALVLATQIRADSEREGKELRDKYTSEAEAIKDEAQRRADEILKEAEASARSIIGDAETNAHEFDQRIRDAEELAQRIRAHLADFLRTMLEEVDRRNEESASIVGDLLARAGETTRSEWDTEVAVPELDRDGSRGMAELGSSAGEQPPFGA